MTQAAKHTTDERRDLYSEVTQTIMAALERGVVPWRSPILASADLSHPSNLLTGRPYSGINVFLLALRAWAEGYRSSRWLTFKQALERGGSVRKGERAALVVFWKLYETKDRQTGGDSTFAVLRHYHVFNIEQCDGIDAAGLANDARAVFQPIERAAAIVGEYISGPATTHGGCKAFYRPSSDEVRVPEPTVFVSPEAYYATLFHELAHSTGHSSRLDRKLDTDPKPFGTADYSREELIAEMAAAFLAADAGITPPVIDNQAGYIASWLGVLAGDKRMVIAAAGAAQRAADWIRGRRSTS